MEQKTPQNQTRFPRLRKFLGFVGLEAADKSISSPKAPNAIERPVATSTEGYKLTPPATHEQGFKGGSARDVGRVVVEGGTVSVEGAWQPPKPETPAIPSSQDFAPTLPKAQQPERVIPGRDIDYSVSDGGLTAGPAPVKSASQPVAVTERPVLPAGGVVPTPTTQDGPVHNLRITPPAA